MPQLASSPAWRTILASSVRGPACRFMPMLDCATTDNHAAVLLLLRGANSPRAGRIIYWRVPAFLSMKLKPSDCVIGCAFSRLCDLSTVALTCSLAAVSSEELGHHTALSVRMCCLNLQGETRGSLSGARGPLQPPVRQEIVGQARGCPRDKFTLTKPIVKTPSSHGTSLLGRRRI